MKISEWISNNDTMPNEQVLLGRLPTVLALLASTTGVAGRVVQTETFAAQTTNRFRHDAFVEFTVEQNAYRYAVEAKIHVDRLAALGHIKQQLGQYHQRGLLYAPYLTATLARKCRELDLEFLDTAGNAYLKLPGAHIYITGEKPTGVAAVVGKASSGTAAALRVIFALLCKPELLNAPYREIVDAARVAMGAVGRVFSDLDQRGYIAGGAKKHTRRFVERERLFNEWVAHYPVRLRPKLNTRRFRAPNNAWWADTNLQPFGAYWGGEVAAERLTHYLKPNYCTIYIKPEQAQVALPKLIAAHRLQADPDGDIEIRDAFWQLPDHPAYPDIAPPILVYADLVATHSPRNLEAAEIVRERWLDDALRQT
jgi:hypothetical protein